jgi:hypothetical protein
MTYGAAAAALVLQQQAAHLMPLWPNIDAVAWKPTLGKDN